MQDDEENSIGISILNLGLSLSQKRINFSESISQAFQSTISTLGELKTNLLYNIKNSDYSIIPNIQRKEIIIKNDGSKVLLLGKQYEYQTEYRFLYVFRNTFWFSYRKNIQEIQSDNGWGCMIRSVQMMFAQVLKRHFKLKENESDHYKVIGFFSQNTQGLLSLKNICKFGNIDKRWTSSLEILGIFKQIIQKTKKIDILIEVYSSGIQYQSKQNLKLAKYPALICLSNRVSLKNIPQTLRNHYFSLMRYEKFVGCIGGVKGQALYIIGSHQSKVIFLDPHYVQSNNLGMATQTYFKKTPRGIDISELSPSISFCYYIENYIEHMQWLDWISKTTKENYPDIIFEIISENDKKKLQKKQKYLQEYQQQFQILQ